MTDDLCFRCGEIETPPHRCICDKCDAEISLIPNAVELLGNGFRNIKLPPLSKSDLQDIQRCLDRMSKRRWLAFETAPRDGTRFLAYEEGHYYAVAWSEQFDDWLYYCGQPVVEDCRATHWAALPPPPPLIKGPDYTTRFAKSETVSDATQTKIVDRPPYLDLMNADQTPLKSSPSAGDLKPFPPTSKNDDPS